MSDKLAELKEAADRCLDEMNNAYAESDYWLGRAKSFEEDYQDALAAWKAESERLVG